MAQYTNKRKPPSEEQLAAVYHLTLNTLRSMRTRGCDPTDARSVFAMLMKTTRKPDTWKDFFASEDEDSHEYWKREKTKEEVDSLRLKNAKAAGEMFEKSDGEKIQEAWAATLKVKIADMKATLPQSLAGKDEPELRAILDDRFHRLLTELSDFEDAAWRETFERYAKTETLDHQQGKTPNKLPTKKKSQAN